MQPTKQTLALEIFYRYLEEISPSRKNFVLNLVT